MSIIRIAVNLFDFRYAYLPKKAKLLIASSLCLSLLSSCAVNNPNSQFPAFKSQLPETENIALVVDVLSVADIDGGIDGVDENLLRQTTKSLAIAAKKTLDLHGFRVKAAHVNSGLFVNEKEQLVFAVDDKPTGVAVDFPILDKQAPIWSDPATVKFLRETVQSAQRYKAKAKPNPLAVPSALESLELDAVVVVKIGSRDVGLGKSLGVGVLTGLLTGFAGVPLSGADAEIAIINLKNGEIVWYNRIHDQGGTSGLALVRKSMDAAFSALPNRGKPVVDDSVVIQIPDKNGLQKGGVDTIVQSAVEIKEPNWTINSAKQALRQSQLSRSEYTEIVRPLIANYKNAVSELKKALKENQIDQATYDKEVEKTRVHYFGNS